MAAEVAPAKEMQVHLESSYLASIDGVRIHVAVNAGGGIKHGKGMTFESSEKQEDVVRKLRAMADWVESLGKPNVG